MPRPYWILSSGRLRRKENTILFETAEGKKYIPFIVDRVIFHLLSKGSVDESDFDQDLNYCYLSESGRKKFISEIDNRLSQTVFHSKLKRKVSFRGLIRLELYKLLKHIIGDEVYSPLKSWW